MAEKLNSGSWRVRYRKYGRRYSKMFPTKDIALKFEANLRLDKVDDFLKCDNADLTFAEFADRWMSEYCEIEKAETQWKEDRSVIENYLKPTFGTTEVGSLRKTDLNELKLRLQKSQSRRRTPFAPKTINNILGLAKKMMNTAVEWEMVSRNPFSDVKKIKMREQDFDYWTAEERDQFLSRCYVDDPEFADAVLIACHTGLRLGELAGLTWGALDFGRKMFFVKDTYCYKLKKDFDHTKTHDKAIYLPMNPVVIETLSRRKACRRGLTVFPNELLKDAARKLQSRCRKHEVRPIRFHDLRHTFASCLAMAGVDLMVIKDLMRHKSYQMTLRYAHLHPEHLRGATDVLTAVCALRGPTLAHDGKQDFLPGPRLAHETQKRGSATVTRKFATV